MSFTAAYTELESLAEGGPSRGVTITDMDGLLTVPDSVEIDDATFQQMLVTDEWTDHSAYPKETWDVLKGFKSWKPTDAFGLDYDPDLDTIIKKIKSHEDYREEPLGYVYNIERCGIPYGGLEGEWKRLFAAVSEHTKPFAFYHSPREHTFADVTDFAEGTESVYYVECHDGAARVEEQTFERTGTEVLLDEVSDRDE